MALRKLFVALASLGLGLSASAQEAVIGPPLDAGNAFTTSLGLPDSGDADCDGSGTLDAFDFLCFQSLFAAGDPGADCDSSGMLDFFDYLCFHNAFAAGFASPEAAPAQPDWMGRPAPGEWCVTYQRHLADPDNQVAVVCAANGPCDDPVDRNASIPSQATPIKTVRLSIHVFCENNGGNCAATQADVVAAVVRLNADFAPWRIQFVSEVNFINKTTYRYLDPYTETGAMKNAYANSPATKLNIYVVNTGGISWATMSWSPQALGWQGGIVVHDAFFVDAANSPEPTILTHEVGHCLGLEHTFHGVDEVPLCGDCYETAGRSAEQGDVTGDWCSDTNPTPKNLNNCADPLEADPCSNNSWAPTPFHNYMGYSHTCRTEFTPQQAGRMHCWTADVLSGWLEVPAPPAAPGTPALTKIGGGVVRATWADNSGNETGFRVQRETKSGQNWTNTQIVATVGANTNTATDAPGTGAFRYRVQAFNGVGDSAWSAWKQINN